MIIHTNMGEIKIGKCVGDVESLPRMCFECKILNKNLYDEVENIISEEKKRQFDKNKSHFNELGYGSLAEFEAGNAVNDHSYIIFFLRRTSDKITALYEKGGTDERKLLDYCASVRLEIEDSKQELKAFILSALEH